VTPGPSRPWDPFGLWGQVAGNLQLPGVPPLPAVSPFSPLKPLLDRVVALVRSRLIGRRVTVRTAHTELRLTLTDLDVALDTLAMTAGQLEGVRVAARDVTWGDLAFTRVTATLRNTHVRPGATPTLVAAPVDLVLTLAEEVVAELVATHRPRLAAEITDDAEPRLRWADRPDWGHLRVTLDVDGVRVRIHPETLVVGDRAVDQVGRLPAFTVALPLPADRARLVDVDVVPHGLVLRARLDEWSVPLATRSVDELMRRISTAASVLDLSRWPRG
jgi:hypothetical protein